MSQTEILGRSRRRILWGSTVGFVGWQAMKITTRIVDASLSRQARVGLMFGALAFFLVWVYYLVRLMLWQRAVAADRIAASALTDELYQHARFKAAAAGFAAVMAFQIVPLLVPLPAAALADSTMAVGMVTFCGAFLYFDRG